MKECDVDVVRGEVKRLDKGLEQAKTSLKKLYELLSGEEDKSFKTQLEFFEEKLEEAEDFLDSEPFMGYLTGELPGQAC